MFTMNFKEFDCLRLCGRYSQKSGWDHAGNTLGKNMLFLLESGDCQFKINGKIHSLSVNDILFIPKNTLYQPSTEGGCSYQYFHFDAEQISELSGVEKGCAYAYCEPLPQAEQILSVPYKCVSDHQTREELSAVIDEMRSDAPESHIKMHLNFFSALVRLSERAREECVKPADQVKLYLADHALEKITLSELALRFGYTKQHIIRIFKERFGMTPTDFIDRCRLERSLLLLSESNMTVEEIALASGFEDASYFSRRFRKRYATSPTAYRRRLQSGL